MRKYSKGEGKGGKDHTCLPSPREYLGERWERGLRYGRNVYCKSLASPFLQTMFQSCADFVSFAIGLSSNPAIQELLIGGAA